MRVSNTWLKELVDIEDDAKTIADKMVLVGNEYESINELCPSTNLVIGKVITKVSHPDSDHLNICGVDLGDGVYQIVCGAPNVDVGQKVIVAKEGAKLPGGEIKKSVIRGVESNGMICSLAELGLESKYVKEEDKKGIHVLDENAPVGEDAKKYLGLDDIYVDYELTANRSDLLSMMGMAYEVGAIYSKKVNLPDNSVKEINEKTEDNISIECKTNKCKTYFARIVRNVTIGGSPEFIKSRLMSAGIRPINNVVDISNYVMIESGQPLHFFDLDKIGKKIIIRQAADKEKITTLDGIERTLKEKDIVICDESNPIALAGVMGGLDTEVTENTKNILIESAVFDPYTIRYTSKEILRSEASIRYEKGINVRRTKGALDRAAHLLSKYADGQVLNGIVGFNDIDTSDKEIQISLEKINNVLGMQISNDEVSDIFKRLGFDFKESNGNYKVNVPYRRLDVNIKEDLIEEVGRIHGYKNMVGTLPIVPIKKGGLLPKNKYIKDIKNRLYSLGLNEVITYSLINSQEIDLFKDKSFEFIKVSSPLTEDKSIMRYSLLPSLLKTFDYNTSRNVKDVCIFETSKIYYLENDYKEVNKLGILMSGNYVNNSWNNSIQVDFYTIKGVLESLFSYLNIINRYKLIAEDMPNSFHPYVSAKIMVDNECVGYIGKPHPNVNKKDVYLCELDLDKLYSIQTKDIKYKEISKYPSIVKDMAFILNNNINAGDVINYIVKKGGRIVSNVDVFDVFKEIEPGKKSIAFKITFEDASKTLTDEEVNVVFNNIITDVKTEFNAILRNK